MLKDYSLRQYALAYAKVGMAVFPLVPKSKNPATQHGFQDATTDLLSLIWILTRKKESMATRL